MAILAVERTKAPRYSVQAGDTLATIAKKNGLDDWKALAEYNWGTTEPGEVNRALIEQIGSSHVNWSDPEESKLDPAFGPKGSAKQILIPSAWKPEKPLALEQTHVITVRKRLPAPAISITTLDKWFLPGVETCDIEYDLEGIQKRADKVDLVIYASNYSKATGTETDLLVDYNYAALPDTPIFERKGTLPAGERDSHEYRGWKGESEAGQGVLKKRGGTRYINAACSPYTVLLRYYKQTADEKARIDLDPFWVEFDEHGAAKDDSLTVTWKVKECARLKHGQLIVWDKSDDNVIFRAALDKGALDRGEYKLHEDPNFKKAELTPDDMPYRVQIQAHTGVEDDNGVALAVMHTEVRLFAHAELGKDPNDPLSDPQCFEFAIAPYLPEEVEKKVAANSFQWYRLKLAQAGFHPGPAHKDASSGEFEIALKEFQRSYPKTKAKPSDDFELLGASGSRNADSASALRRETSKLTKNKLGLRPLFGDPDTRLDYSREHANERLNEPDESMIVWIDDRHTYTEGASVTDVNYNPKSNAADCKVAQDAKAIARPWLPVELSLLLMTKGTELNATAPAGELSEERLKAMCAATGPIRLDWTFREPGEDYSVIELADYPKYKKKYTRTRAYIEAQIKHFKGTHNGADAFNCPVDQGGIRPHPAIGDYYQAVFGLAEESLLPSKALADGGKKLVCTVTHDDLGDKEDWVYKEQIGKTGVYLRPSIIAGDGYQFRAQVSFEDLPSGSSHPNWKVLKKRYGKLPQAHTCRMRNWRRTSLRGYLGWAAPGKRHWGSYERRFPDFYRPAFLRWEHEGGSPSNYPLTSFFDPDADADVKAYKKLISDNVGAAYQDKDKISLSEDYIWPWTDQTQLGVVKVPPPGVTFANYDSTFLNDDFWNKTWRKFRGPLMNELLKKIGEKFGKLRGHLIVEFDSPAYWVQEYRCSTCGKKQVRMERTAGGDGGLTAGETCRIGGCGGALEVVYKQTFVCDECSGEQSATGRATFLDGDVGTCDNPCTGHLTYVGRVTPSLWHPLTKKSKYRCPACGNEPLFTESAPYGSRAGTACGRPCPGHLSAKAPSDRAKRIQKGGDDLGFPAVGLAFGGAYLYASALEQSWAHECGHHRFVEHAATAPGADSKRAQHDSEANPKYNTVDAPKYLEQTYDGWDLICIMGYVKDSANGIDERFFCGKCILKTRGWKVESGLQLTAEVDP